MKEVKEKKCKNCGAGFRPYKTTDRACSWECAKAIEKEKGKGDSEREESERRVLTRVLVKVFHSYVRERDKGKGCICCGKPLGKSYHAGHFYSGGGHGAVRFNEDNVHAQRSDCNTEHRAGTLEGMAVRVEERIGSDAFEVLRSEAYKVKRWDCVELKNMIEFYKLKKRGLRHEKDL